MTRIQFKANQVRRTVHAEAGESATVIETGALVLTRVRCTLINIHLAPVSRVARCAVTPKRAGGINTPSSVLARRHPTCTITSHSVTSDLSK